MPKPLTTKIQQVLDEQNIRTKFVFKINGTTNPDLLNWSIRADRSFGTVTGTFDLRNPEGKYSDGNASEIRIGAEVELVEYYAEDATPFPRFFGLVRQRSVNKDAQGTTISLQCLDLLIKLQEVDIDAVYEGTKTEIKNETLTPVFLPAPNNMYANLFNFRNDSIAEVPPPIVTIRERGNRIPQDPEFEGFQIRHDVGQLQLGLFLNARDNYDVVIPSYYFYSVPLNVEDVLETLLTTNDAYGNKLFSGSTTQNIIDTYLTTSLYEEDNKTTDTLRANLVTQFHTIKATLTAGAGPGVTSLSVDSSSGFPTAGSGSGLGSINGDVFTWTGKTATTLTGVPATGDSAILGHHNGEIVKYRQSYSPGSMWFLSYSNLVDDLVAGDFTVPGGTISYIDKRNGLILLESPIASNSTVTLNRSYRFKSLQATGIETDRVEFRERGIENRFTAASRLRDLTAPNYILRTRGTRRIVGQFLNQKTTADYTLQLPTSLQYLDDQEVYTLVVIFGKNNNPTNIMFDENVAFVSTGQQFTATATNVELTYEKDLGAYRVYKSALTDIGRIITTDRQPSVTVNNIPINDQPVEVLGSQVTVDRKTQVVTTTEQRGKQTDVRTETFIFYTVKLPHTNIDRNQSILVYDATATLLATLAPNDSNMNYESGEWVVPGNQQNDVIERISTADYHVRYATNQLTIDFGTTRFHIAKLIVPSVANALVKATFDYQTAVSPIRTGGFAFDGRYDTQVQTVFYAEPPSGFPYAIIDLGALKTIQAIDITAGFFKPDPNSNRRFDVDMALSLYASDDNVSYRVIDAKLNNFKLSGGESAQFEEDVLGEGFQTRYVRMNLERVGKIDFETGVWPVAFTEIQAFTDIVLRSEAKLIPNTKLTATAASGAGTLTVSSTGSFPQTGSGFINELDSFDYTGKTTTTFTGVTGIGTAHGVNERVAQLVAGDTTIYDDRGLLERYGDKVFKDREVNSFLDTQEKIDRRAKLLLKEFVKNHRRVQTEVLYGPHYDIGQTVLVPDAQQSVNENFFIEAISDTNGQLSLELARYPA